MEYGIALICLILVIIAYILGRVGYVFVRIFRHGFHAVS